MSGEGTAGYCLVPELWGSPGLSGSLRTVGSRTALSCSLSWTPPSPGDESVTSAEDRPHGCWPFLCRDADVSGQFWAQAASPGCAVTDKLWHGQGLILQITVKLREGLCIPLLILSNIYTVCRELINLLTNHAVLLSRLLCVFSFRPCYC